jgi:hypothetical protein
VHRMQYVVCATGAVKANTGNGKTAWGVIAVGKAQIVCLSRGLSRVSGLNRGRGWAGRGRGAGYDIGAWYSH